MSSAPGLGMRRAALLVLGLALALVWWRPWEPPVRWAVGGRVDLLLDGAHVELLEGFGERAELQIWGDHPRPNLDRDELLVPMPRNGRLRWAVEAREGGARLLARVGRLHPGPAADETPARLAVVAHRSDGREEALAEVVVPAIPAEAAQPEGVLREGSAAEVALDLPRLDPEAGDRLELRFVAEGTVDGYLALHSPRVEGPPRWVAPSDLPLRFAREMRLTALGGIDAQAEQLSFATRSERLPPEEHPLVDEVLSCPPVSVEGAFEGRIGRHALVFTGAAAWSAELTIPGGATFETAVALDARLPAGATARLEVLVDGRSLASVEVTTVDWHPLAVSLAAVAGEARRLELRASVGVLPDVVVTRIERDYVRRDEVPTEWRAQTTRLGLAEPRVTVPIEVPRRAATRDTPSVLVLHVETLRADALSPWGAPAERTPNLTRLAARSTLYEVAIAPSSWTLPSTATLLTGLPPSAHGVDRYDRSVIPDALPTLAEQARDAGVVTAAFVTNTSVLRADAGFGRGFGTYAQLPFANARQVNDLLGSFVGGHAGQQWLAFVHYYDPHGPVTAPGDWCEKYVDPAWRGRDAAAVEDQLNDRVEAGEILAPDDPDVVFLIQRYVGEVAFFDHQLGRLLALLDEQGLAESTCVILTADHGEEFGEHGLLGHGRQLTDETLHVPLLVAEPGALVGWARGEDAAAPAGRRVPEVVSTGGLYAAILDRLAVLYDERAVLPALGQAADRARALAELATGLDRMVLLAEKGDPLRRSMKALRTDDHLIVWHLSDVGEEGQGRWEFFDLATDPGASQPLSAEGPAFDWHRQALLEAWEWGAQRAAAPPGAGLGAEQLRALEELGYLLGRRKDGSP